MDSVTPCAPEPLLQHQENRGQIPIKFFFAKPDLDTVRQIKLQSMTTDSPPPHPVTPDGRYFVVRGRLWRKANPDLPEVKRTQLVSDLMHARRQVAAALRAQDADAKSIARQRVNAAKRGLGERGAVWWHDGTPDYNRRMALNTPYGSWYAEQSEPKEPDLK